MRIGDYVFVEKGGEIIPKVTSVDLTKRDEKLKPVRYITNCPECGTGGDQDDSVYDVERVAGLCADAACALLVSDAVANQTVATLTAPVKALVPVQRKPPVS